MRRRREPLSGSDAFWLRSDRPDNHMTIGGLLLFASEIDLDTIRARVEVGLRAYPRFFQRVIDRHEHPSWEDADDVDIERHIVLEAGQFERDDDLQELLGRLTSTSLDFTQPLWKVHLISRGALGSALLFRIHHCLADGTALIRVLLSLTSDAPESTPSMPSNALDHGLFWRLLRPSGTRGGRAESMLHKGLELAAQPSKLVQQTRQGVDFANALARLTLLPPDRPTSLKGKLSGSKRVCWSASIPLTELKTIARATNATVNDVLLATACGALRRYFEARGEAIADERPIRVTVPVDLRAESAKIELGNRFGLVFVDLPIGLASPKARLEEIKRSMLQLKQSPEAAVGLGILQTVGRASESVEKQVVQFFSKKASAIMTNVVGPSEPLYLGHDRIERMMFWVPQTGGIGVGFSFLSYNGEVTLTTVADRSLIEDPSLIAAALDEERIQMREALGAPPAAQ